MKLIKKCFHGFCIAIALGMIYSVIASEFNGKFVLLSSYFTDKFNNFTNTMIIYLLFWGILGIVCILIKYFLDRKKLGILIKNAVYFLIAYIFVVILSIFCHIIPINELFYFSIGMIVGYLIISLPKYIWIKNNVKQINHALKNK